MRHLSLFRESEESSYQTTPVVKLDDDGDLSLEITHGDMIDDYDVEDEEYALHMDDADATTEDSEDDERTVKTRKIEGRRKRQEMRTLCRIH